jgi:hypothetical protein
MSTTTQPAPLAPPARVFVMSVLDTLRPNEDPVWGVFTTEEHAIKNVHAMVGDDGGDWGREEPVFLIKGVGLTWQGVQVTSTEGIMKYSGVFVSIVSREVRP